MPVYETRLTWRETVAEGTIAFQLERPAGFVHDAGQNILMMLIDPPETDSEGSRRAFTIASAAREPEPRIATRMRNTNFKRVLKVAMLGLKIPIDGPNGGIRFHARPPAALRKN